MRSPTTRPFPYGLGVAWQADGMVCTATPAGLKARAAWTGPWDVGPHGALALSNGDQWVRIGGPERTPLPCTPFDVLAWSHDGTRSEVPGPGPTVGWAQWGSHLVGPGGRHWDLESGQSLVLASTGSVIGAGPAGLLVGDGERFSWSDWQGSLVQSTEIPVSGEAAIDRVSGIEGGFLLWGPLGRCWRLSTREVTAVEVPRPRRPRARRRSVNGVALRVAGDLEVGSHRWVWTPSGMLLQSIGNS
jgi:hypothetical protein